MDSPHISSSSQWTLPINFASRSWPYFDTQPTLWIKNKTISPTIAQIKPDEWFMLNVEASYYYLVNYYNRNWILLAAALNSEDFSGIPPLSRAKLFYDAFTLAKFDKLKYSLALQLTKYLPKETDYIVWDSFFYVFRPFYKQFSGLTEFHYLQVCFQFIPTIDVILKNKL